MKSFKVPVLSCAISCLFIIFLCKSVDVKPFKLHSQQQRHFITLQSKPLYLSKSLSSREHITLPLDRLFSISSTLPQSQSYSSIISFSPTTVKLSDLKHSTFIEFESKKKSGQPLFGKEIISPSVISANQSILNDLRTPLPHQISQIVVLNQNLTFLFVFPAQVIVLEQMTNTFTITSRYEVQQFINISAQKLSFYALNDSYVMGNTQDTNQFYLFDAKGYKKLQNQAQISTLEHVHTFDAESLEFFTAERENGLKHCKINLASNKIQLITKFETANDIGLNLSNQPLLIQNKDLEIYDVSFNRDLSEIYILDINLGVIKFKYGSHKDQDSTPAKNVYQISPNTTSLLINQRGCQALDYIPNDRLVLICEQRKRRFFIEAYYNQNQSIFNKQPPVFHNNNFDDLQITKEYYIAFEQSSIDIFWPSKNNFIPQIAHNKKHINLLGMQSYKIYQNSRNQLYLYSIRNNVLIKERLELQTYVLSIGSEAPIRTSFFIQAFGSCESLFFNLNDRKKYAIRFSQDEISKLNQQMSQYIKKYDKGNELCKLRIPIELETSRYIFQNRGKFSLAMGIWIICILIAFALTCICMKKYLGMEKAAQQTLIQLKKGQKNIPQFVL